MKKLNEYNAERFALFSEANSNNPCPNGIECSHCTHELMDSYPNRILTSNPPKKDVHCPNCGYKGYRYI